MGRNAALNVAREGFEMIVHDVRPEAMTPLVERGATAAGSPADVLDQVDFVVTWCSAPGRSKPSSAARTLRRHAELAPAIAPRRV